ncbi:hypothetical protein N566_19765 [Streptomycetaceae bacterium MP113-05]|nr:hypothetical protein N566_19765 [Streptomycetaceae bacterium MP113-05]
MSAGLMLSGCSEDTGNTGESKETSAEDKPAQESGDSQGGGETGGEPVVGPVDAADVKGQWETGSVMDGDYVVLSFGSNNATTVVTEEATCNGSYTQDGDNVSMELVCRKGSGFEKGSIKGMGDQKLTVAWDSGDTDVFTPSD